MPEILRVSFVTGTEPGKWFSRFRENPAGGRLAESHADDPLGQLLAGEVTVALTRLPDARITTEYHVVRLYTEAPGVAVPKDSIFAAVGEDVDPAELADDICNYRLPPSGEVDVAAVRAALQIVAANVGHVLGPRPLLKQLSKNQVVDLGLRAAEVPGTEVPGTEMPGTEIALVWRKADDDEDIQTLVGVCKGRKATSSRGVQVAKSRKTAVKKVTKKATGRRPRRK